MERAFSGGLPFYDEVGENGLELLEVCPGEASGAEVVLDGVAGGDGLAGFGARAGGGGCFRRGGGTRCCRYGTWRVERSTGLSGGAWMEHGSG